ncbi:unnamed protein product [Phyllotreta striolata]|uniref:BMP and activin membrane-bound inhibitor-like protein n=1 Tax=Phyllotreta striolata TaxID=444603 RepID=A0A9N9XPY9_PHYSR|nr:unnamed protein product [Phyllotreta striolata]
MTLAICLYYFYYCCLSLLTAIVSASEETVTINKPIVKFSKPWHYSTEYVRCFCNLPNCIMTGYMCKSSGGGCFSKINQTNNDNSQHGCLELLKEKYKCHGKAAPHERTTFRRKENARSHLMCCHHDLCNHIESPQTKNLINSTALDEYVEEVDNKYEQKQETFLYSDSEVWFRAATIAVPICGAVILFVLIALAIKILKTEHQNSALDKLGPPLYIQPIAHHKYPKGRQNQDNFHQTYDSLLQKDYVISPHNNYYCSNAEDFRLQLHEPLIQCESSTSGEEKNSIQARYNLVNCEVSGKSIIMEIEKEKPPCSPSNVSCNSKCINKYCADKSFLS